MERVDVVEKVIPPKFVDIQHRSMLAAKFLFPPRHKKCVQRWRQKNFEPEPIFVRIFASILCVFLCVLQMLSRLEYWNKWADSSKKKLEKTRPFILSPGWPDWAKFLPTYWAIDYIGQFLIMYNCSPNFWAIFSYDKS
jgi:hypothetical protein